MNARQIMKGLYEEEMLRRAKEKAIQNLKIFRSKLTVPNAYKNSQNTLARNYINKMKTKSVDPATVLKEYKYNALNRQRAIGVINRMKGLVTRKQKIEQFVGNFPQRLRQRVNNRRKLKIQTARQKMNEFLTPARLNKLAGNNAKLEQLLNMAKKYSKNLNSSEDPNKTAEEFKLQARRITNSIPRRVANNGNNYGLNHLYNNNNQAHPLPVLHGPTRGNALRRVGNRGPTRRNALQDLLMRTKTTWW